MKIIDLINEDFVNYKGVPVLFIAFPFCTFKCEKECGESCCQNAPLTKQPIIEIELSKIIQYYLKNPITKAIVFGGLEPFDSFDEIHTFISELRQSTDDPIIIYTGYYETEIEDQIKQLQQFQNIIVKFGRFIPNQPHHIDPILGVELASPNQYAKKIS